MGNKGYIGTKGQPINTEQGEISGVKDSTGNKGSIGNKGRSSIQIKVKSQMTKFSGK